VMNCLPFYINNYFGVLVFYVYKAKYKLYSIRNIFLSIFKIYIYIAEVYCLWLDFYTDIYIYILVFRLKTIIYVLEIAKKLESKPPDHECARIS